MAADFAQLTRYALFDQRIFSLFFAGLGQKRLGVFLGGAVLFSVALGQARAEP
jgi:hypothetical protein